MSRKTCASASAGKNTCGPSFTRICLPGTGWSATLGTLCALLFGVMAVTGIFLAMYYNPSPDKAYQSIDYIMKDVPMGALLRGIHHWGAGAMVLLVFIHLLANFFSGTYKAPREATWIVGVCLFLVTLGLGFTGYLLPWDMKAYWATVVSSNIPRDIPVIGDFITRLIRGGETVSGLTLTRFYAIHMLLLPALLAVFTAYTSTWCASTVWLNRRSETRCRRGTRKTGYRFFPEHAFRSALVFAVVFLVIVGLAIFGTIPREANRRHVQRILPAPARVVLHVALPAADLLLRSWETVGSLAIPTAGIALLFAVPFLARVGQPRGGSPTGRRRGRKLHRRHRLSDPHGLRRRTALRADHSRARPPLTASEATRPLSFRRPGVRLLPPDPAAKADTAPDPTWPTCGRHRTKDYSGQVHQEPASGQPHSIMPKYNLPDADLQVLADFVLALDFSRYQQKILRRGDFAKFPDKAGAPGASAFEALGWKPAVSLSGPKSDPTQASVIPAGQLDDGRRQ